MESYLCMKSLITSTIPFCVRCCHWRNMWNDFHAEITIFNGVWWAIAQTPLSINGLYCEMFSQLCVIFGLTYRIYVSFKVARERKSDIVFETDFLFQMLTYYGTCWVEKIKLNDRTYILALKIHHNAWKCSANGQKMKNPTRNLWKVRASFFQL